jgi:signal transduction histidine kinase/CheY-like chemotaxis protein/purine-cytosine permease-like protein
MAARQRIVRERREYNQWVANQTLEDYALRFTAKSARRWSPLRVANTALGSISFLALEAIGGTITVAYGFTNSVAAILAVSLLIFAISLPICFYAARDGVDVDLLTRGAAFGYIGSTITSLIYASFTFIFFGIESVIVASMLESFFGVPLWLGYMLCAAAVLPLVTHGITLISRFQLVTQPIWLVLNLAALIAAVLAHPEWLAGWTRYHGLAPTAARGFDPLAFGACASILLALIAQTAEQVDYLRFLPPRAECRRGAWWAALLAGGPGWIVFDVFKLLAGSFLAYGLLTLGQLPESAVQPAQMYLVAFRDLVGSPGAALLLTSFFVVLSQLKINLTNAYAGSIAWSNFFSRLTHSHPGRVVWLVFNIAIALLLMELGAYETIQRTLVVYSDVAAAWIAALVADLVVNKSLGLSPPRIEFKRAHLYDINPVGVGAMLLAVVVSLAAWAGAFGPWMAAMSTFVAFLVAFVTAPLIAWATGGKYYLARKPRTAWGTLGSLQCSICEHAFEPEDMAYCPVYTGPICSLCCSLDARCNDGCKPHARAGTQILGVLGAVLPAAVMRAAARPLGRFFVVFALFVAAAGVLLLGIHAHTAVSDATAFWQAFVVLTVIGGIAAWLLVLAQESRRVAQEETRRQTGLLMSEIRAHRRTDAALQRARDVAESASLAKSHFVTSINHELRSPLNAILGYAQLLERDPASLERRSDALRIIRRSGEHLAALVEGLLDISRIEAKRIDIYRDEVALPEFLGQLTDMFRLQAEEKGIGFIFDGAGKLPDRVHTDEHRLRQILINLLSNAIKFTPKGAVTLRVRWRAEVAEFEVIDTGIGIAADDLERIFEPLQRVKSARGAVVPGMGLGLTIAKVLTEIMGGEISVTSTPGAGSRFRVRMMLSQSVRPAGSGPGLAERRISGYRGARRHVVVADDDEMQRALMTDVLTPLGFTVATARDGAECLEIAAGRTPDLFLIDLSMPGINGWELAAELRELHPVVPIVIISADGRELKQPPGDAAHHDDTLTKPVSLSALLERIGRLLALEWVFQPDDGAGAAAPDGSAGASLDPGRIAVLRDLAAIGYVSGLRTQIDVFEREAPHCADQFARMRALLAEYRLDDFLAELDAAARAAPSLGIAVEDSVK